MMQMLDAGGLDLLTDAVRAPDESNPRGYLEYEPVKASARSTDWVENAEGKVVKVIAQLVQHLPAAHDYAIVFMHRDLDEILASQAAMLARLGRKAAAMNYATLKTVFGRQLASAEEFAAAQPNMRTTSVEYARVLQDPRAAVESLIAFLGTELDVEKAAGVVDPSLYREKMAD